MCSDAVTDLIVQLYLSFDNSVLLLVPWIGVLLSSARAVALLAGALVLVP